jgi:hypothetical protein
MSGHVPLLGGLSTLSLRLVVLALEAMTIVCTGHVLDISIPPLFCAAFDNRRPWASRDNRRRHPKRRLFDLAGARMRGGYHEVLPRGAWSITFLVGVSYFVKARNRHR